MPLPKYLNILNRVQLFDNVLKSDWWPKTGSGWSEKIDIENPGSRFRSDSNF